jgi:hypothetical protein
MGNNKSRAAISQCAMNVSIASSPEQISIALSKVRFQGQPDDICSHWVLLSLTLSRQSALPLGSGLARSQRHCKINPDQASQVRWFPCRPCARLDERMQSASIGHRAADWRGQHASTVAMLACQAFMDTGWENSNVIADTISTTSDLCIAIGVVTLAVGWISFMAEFRNRRIDKTKTAPLPAPFLVHHWIMSNSTGADGSDPLGHCDLYAIREWGYAAPEWSQLKI